MARKRSQNTALFDALTIEGALIAPAMIAQIAQREAENQTEADYSVPKGLTLRDEIARYFRIGQALFGELQDASPKATVRTVAALLRDVFGFADIQPGGIRTHEGRQFAVSLEALGGRVPVIVVPPADDLDRASDHIPGDGRRRSAASAIQDWLNANDGALWGFACNGERLRLVRDNASLTRPAYIEATCARSSRRKALRILRPFGSSSMPADSARPPRPRRTACWNAGATQAPKRASSPAISCVRASRMPCRSSARASSPPIRSCASA